MAVIMFVDIVVDDKQTSVNNMSSVNPLFIGLSSAYLSGGLLGHFTGMESTGPGKVY
jgi:hypothetical protein